MGRVSVKRVLLTGLAAVLPLGLTAFVFYWCVDKVNQLLGKPINSLLEKLLDTDLPDAVGVIIAIILVIAILLVTGSFLTSYLGRQLFRAIDSLLSNVPIVRAVYPAAKQVTDFFFHRREQRFERVVAIEYPRKGVYSLAFVTGSGLKSLDAPDGRARINVLVPNCPAPLTGFLLFVPEDEVVSLSITPDEAIRMIISFGIIIPPSELKALMEKPIDEATTQE